MMPEKYFLPLKRGSRKVVVVSHYKYLGLDEFYPSLNMKQFCFVAQIQISKWGDVMSPPQAVEFIRTKHCHVYERPIHHT